MAKRYSCPYCDYKDERAKLVKHIDKNHEELIPEGFTSTRLVFNIVNKKECGNCRVCKAETTWNEKAGRYDTLCSNPKCKQAMRDEYKKNMLRVKGTYNILNDPEQQTKMLANRSISGKYKHSDGNYITYTGSYEKKCLEFMDVVIQIPSKDIMAPGPTIEYELNGEKHFYITDFYYIPMNLIIEVKDGGDNLNTKDSPSMRLSREKTIAKEKLITDRGIYNYVRLTNNNFAQLIDVMMEIKKNNLEGIDGTTVRINEFEHRRNVSMKVIQIEDAPAFESALPEISDKVILDEFKVSLNTTKVLYHGTDIPNLDIIEPNSYNIGTKFSKPRTSSYWFANIEYAKTFAAMTVLDNRLPKDKWRIILDDDMKILCIKKFKNQTIKALKNNKGYVYCKKVDSSLISNGQARYFPEYTIDIPVKPDSIYTVEYDDMISRIKFVDEDYFAKVLTMYEKDKMTYNASLPKRIFDRMTKYDYNGFRARKKALKRYTKSSKKCLIISCFAGIGKNYAIEYFRNAGLVVNDIEKTDSIKNMFGSASNFIGYINHMADESDILFIPYFYGMEKDYIQGTVDYYLVYPAKSCKNEYLDRFRDIGFTPDRIEYFSDNWDELIRDCKTCKIKQDRKIELRKGEYLLDTIKELRATNESALLESLTPSSEIYRGFNVSYDTPRITKSWGVTGSNGVYNQCVKVSSFNKPIRGRSEILIIKDDKVFLSFKNNGDYELPGGGWDPDEYHMDTAIREAQEEVRINVKNVQPASIYIIYSDKPRKWVAENIPKKDWWYGYYTEVYIGEYESKYTGFIDEVDQDNMINTGKFYKIVDVYDKLIDIHKKAIREYVTSPEYKYNRLFGNYFSESSIFNFDLD